MPLKRVLIVEDSVDVGRLYQDIIRSAYPGVPITFVPSAEEGILEASRYNFDLLVADIRLPGISGFDLVRRVRARQPQIKVIMVTGLKIDQDLERQSQMVGAELLLPKPLSIADFLASVEKITGEVPHASPEEVEASRPKHTGRTGGLRRAVSEPKTEPRSAPLPSPAIESNITDKPHDTAPVRRAEEAPPQPPTLGSCLADLRGSLGAYAVILLDDQGNPAAQAGEWPAPEMETRLVPAVMSGLNALQKVAARLQKGGTQALRVPTAAHVIRGEEFDLAFAPVGRYALLVFLRSAPGSLRLALAFEQIISVQAQVAGVLEGMGLVIHTLPVVISPPVIQAETNIPVSVPVAQVPLPEPETETVPEDPAKLEALANLLGEVPKSPGKVDADAFWDNLTSGESPSAPSTGALSYEQAQKLGLVADENK
jgi:CheY-like chemotaxis protein